MNAFRVTVYGRPGCHLCDEAVDSLAEISADLGGIEVDVKNIEADDRLLRCFLEKIPVLEIDGVILSELESRPEVLKRKLEAAAQVMPVEDGYAEGA